MPYGITQCYPPPDTSEHTPPCVEWDVKLYSLTYSVSLSVCLSVSLSVCLWSVCIYVYGISVGQRGGPTAVDVLQWRFIDIEQQLNAQQTDDSQLLRLLHNTQHHTIRE